MAYKPMFSLNIFLNSQAEDADQDGAPRPGMKKISYQWYKQVFQRDRYLWIPEPEPVSLSASANRMGFGFGDVFDELGPDTVFRIAFTNDQCPFDDTIRDTLKNGTAPFTHWDSHEFLGLEGNVRTWVLPPDNPSAPGYDLVHTGRNFSFSLEVDGAVSYWVDPRMNVDP